MSLILFVFSFTKAVPEKVSGNVYMIITEVYSTFREPELLGGHDVPHLFLLNNTVQ